MRIGFVQVYDESDDVLLTVFVRNKAVNILCPFLNVLASGKMRIVRSMSQIHLLVTECQFRHTLTRASEDEIDHSAEARLCQSLVGVFDSTAPQDVSHALRDASALVNGIDLAAPNLEVEPLTAAVVVACRFSGSPTLFRPTALVLVALCCGDSLRWSEIHNLFWCCHNQFPFMCVQLSCPQLAACKDSLPMVGDQEGY